MSARGVIAVFAKPPRPGEVKTRLAATLGAAPAAELAAAFLHDTLALVRGEARATVVLASTEHDRAALQLPPEVPLWLQGEGDLGARQERICARALAGGAPWVLAVGADSPGMPAALLGQAIDALTSGRAVLGPADDGGYVLLGLRACPAGLLAGLPWSSPHTARETLARLASRGLPAAVLAPWFDIDQPEDLARLRGLLQRGEIHAPATARVLERLAP